MSKWDIYLQSDLGHSLVTSAIEGDPCEILTKASRHLRECSHRDLVMGEIPAVVVTRHGKPPQEPTDLVRQFARGLIGSMDLQIQIGAAEILAKKRKDPWT